MQKGFAICKGTFKIQAHLWPFLRKIVIFVHGRSTTDLKTENAWHLDFVRCIAFA